jgi:hypothetical protein
MSEQAWSEQAWSDERIATWTSENDANLAIRGERHSVIQTHLVTAQMRQMRDDFRDRLAASDALAVSAWNRRTPVWPQGEVAVEALAAAIEGTFRVGGANVPWAEIPEHYRIPTRRRAAAILTRLNEEGEPE